MEKEIKKKVFISYSRSNKDRITNLVSALESEGFEVWWDIEIPPGQRYADVIHRALKSADYVIVAWSKTSVKSEWVLREAEVGLDRRVLLPIILEDNVTLPFLFQDRHACNFISWQGDRNHFEYLNLIDAIKQDSSVVSFTNKVAHDLRQQTTHNKEAADNLKKTVTPDAVTKSEPKPHPKLDLKNKFSTKTLGITALAILVGLFVIIFGSSDSPDEGSQDKYTSSSSKPTPAKLLQQGIGSKFTPRLVEAEPKLILRKRASISSTGMDAVDYGSVLLVGDRVSNKEVVNNKEGYWYKTKKQHGRNTLYVFDGYLDYYPIYKVLAPSGLQIRENPTVGSPKVGKLGHGDRTYSLEVQENTVSIDGIKGQWHKIHTGDIEGYVFGAYLMKES